MRAVSEGLGHEGRDRPDRPTRIVAVVVTYNRAELLAACLDALAAQTRAPDAVVVIDNASTDPSGDVARAHAAATQVRTLTENLGGAGGFAAGMALALEEHEPDWIWLMDDDTIPRPGALAALEEAADAHPAPLSVLSSAAVWTDGRDHPMNSQRSRVGAGPRERRAAERLGVTPIRTASFVSILLRASEVRRHGLPWADYFIWGDDTEYSGRLLRTGCGVRVPDSVVEHRTAVFGSWETDPGPRFYYEVRNKLWLYWRTDSFRWWERVMYQGAASLGWVGTLRRSPHPGALVRHARRGLRDAITRTPRTTAEVLAGQAEDVVRAVANAEGHGEPVVVDNRAWGEPPGRQDPSDPGFSVLLPVYGGDEADAFERAFVAATADQTLPPSEVVLVQDGPVERELDETIRAVLRTSEIPVRLVVLPRNSRLAAALQAGLGHCRHEIVARVDADDVSLPTRFATQLPVIRAGADVVGSAMQEYSAAGLGPVREVVTEPEQIAARARWRNPVNHPTVVFRRSAVLAAGGYEDLPFMEDYWLWLRMIGRGARLANVAEPLVRYRVDQVFERRGGIGPLRSDVVLQHRAWRSGHLTAVEAARNLASRVVYRLVPAAMRETGFRLIAERRTHATPTR